MQLILVFQSFYMGFAVQFGTSRVTLSTHPGSRNLAISSFITVLKNDVPLLPV
jgi:hypothetical protein